jgi:hypothetical protein
LLRPCRCPPLQLRPCDHLSSLRVGRCNIAEPFTHRLPQVRLAAGRGAVAAGAQPGIPDAICAHQAAPRGARSVHAQHLAPAVRGWGLPCALRSTGRTARGTPPLLAALSGCSCNAVPCMLCCAVLCYAQVLTLELGLVDDLQVRRACRVCWVYWVATTRAYRQASYARGPWLWPSAAAWDPSLPWVGMKFPPRNEMSQPAPAA